MTTPSDLANIIITYLQVEGWTETKPGQWIPKGHRILKATKRRPERPSCGAYYSLLAAAQSQIAQEYQAARNEQERRIAS